MIDWGAVGKVALFWVGLACLFWAIFKVPTVVLFFGFVGLFVLGSSLILYFAFARKI